MRPMLVEIHAVSVQHVAKAVDPKDHQVLQDFFFDRPDRALGNGVHVGGFDRSGHRRDFSISQGGVQCGPEHAASVMDHVAWLNTMLFTQHASVSCHLPEPWAAGREGRLKQEDSAALDMHDEEDVDGDKSLPGPDLRGGEVAAEQDIQMLTDKLAPRLSLPVWIQR